MDSASRHDFIAHGSTPTKEGPRPWLFTRPQAKTGLISWVTTVDHKRIGLLYGLAAGFFFAVGGFEAILIRLQLALPNSQVLSHQLYNEMFTMHGTTMIFLAVMPLNAAFMNYLMPLQIGARDVAFPRLNGFAFWVYLAGAIIINLGWFTPSGSPDNGWYGYAPLTDNAFSNQFTRDVSTDLWIIGLQVLGVSSILGSLNFIVTIINLRAPGLTMMRLPVFTWMTLVTSFLIILSFPFITIALAELMMDRMFNTAFFDTARGGFPILWQHLFWIFGHPEVYILIMPAFGIISEVIPTFARKPLFGYPIVVFSGAAIGFFGFTVWSHHMFTTGMGNVGTAAFALTTMAIAVPTGVKIFNWIGTIWGGHLQLRTPLLFALGFIWMFMIGGFSGVMHAAAPADTQQNDTYFVVAHFHYVLIGGTLFALLAGLHYWFPLIFGRQPLQGWGRLAFWIIFTGFNLTFFPQHFLGLNGMPRRVAVYDGNMGLNAPNLISTVGTFILTAGLAVYGATLIASYYKGQRTTRDPWDARTLEWAVPTPPPEYNFPEIPRVHARDELWYRKYLQTAGEREQEQRADAQELSREGIHLPDQSWFPFLTALALLAAGTFYAHHHLTGAMAAGAVLFLGVFCWALETPGGYTVYLHDRPDSADPK